MKYVVRLKRGEFLAHCVFGNVLNSKVVEFLKRENYLEN